MASGLRYSEDEFQALRARLATENKPKPASVKPKPTQKRGQPEHEIQVAFFNWVEYHQSRIPNLSLIHAIPNGGHRHGAVAAKMKAEGARKGVLDVQWPVARGGFVGLDIEFKAPGANPSAEQRDRIDQLQKEGWLCVICWSWEAAARVVLGYAGLPKIQFDAVCITEV